MRTENLQLINDVGRALYAKPELAQSRSVETLAAITTLDRLSEEQTFEKALLALLARAEKEGLQASGSGVSYPFYRLSPTERFVLVLLHSGKISYPRLGRILGLTTGELEALAWHARVKLASQQEVRLTAPHPVGTSRVKHQCLEYDGERPWTQRFLDDEMTKQELIMVQNHTTVCESCRRALTMAREFYYAIEAQIPTSNVSAEEVSRTLRQARMKLGDHLPLDLTIAEALRIFLRRRETKITLAVFAAVLFYFLFRV